MYRHVPAWCIIRHDQAIVGLFFEILFVLASCPTPVRQGRLSNYLSLTLLDTLPTHNSSICMYKLSDGRTKHIIV